MDERPADSLIMLLERLQLAAPEEVAAMERRARRLAKGLPLFQTVWVDALVQAGMLTPFQASEIHAGRGDDLRVGPYVLLRKRAGLGFADTYEARHVEAGVARLVAVFKHEETESRQIAEKLDRLVQDAKQLACDSLAPILEWGEKDGRIWVMCDAAWTRTAADWMIHHGRFAPETVLEIARAMMPGLVALEERGLCHGDLRAATLLFGSDGKKPGPRLPLAGLRGILRPHEGYAHLNAAPETLDGLSPERIRDGSPPSIASDIYACGCLWWHLLTGRNPLPGGDGITKLQTAERAAIGDPRLLAPEAPEELLAVIRACTRAKVSERPDGMREVASMLGPAASGSRTLLRREVSRSAFQRPRWSNPRGRTGLLRRRTTWAGVATACVLMIVVGVLGLVGSDLQPKESKTLVVQEKAADEPASRSPVLPEGRKRRGDESELARDEGRASSGTPVPTASRDAVGNSSPGASRAVRLVGGVSEPADLVLPAEIEQRVIDRLPLRPNQKVHGRRGRRVTLHVAEGGLLVDQPGIVFENIDFVCENTLADDGGGIPAAILRVLAPDVRVRSCTFRATSPGVSAIRWSHPSREGGATLALPHGRIVLRDCLFRSVETAVDVRSRGALGIRCVNVLHLGRGALVRIDRCPGPDETLVLSLRQTTLRDSGPLLQCDAIGPGTAGRIRIETDGCVLAPRANTALLSFSGASAPHDLLGKLSWMGQGSLVTPMCSIAAYRDGSGQVITVPEDRVSIEGLVRSKVEFAGTTTGRPADSEASRWLAPLQSERAPGIDPSVFPGR